MLILLATIALAAGPSYDWSLGTDTGPDGAYHLLEVQYTQSQFDEGRAAAELYVSQTPDDPEGHWHLARFLYEQAERPEWQPTGGDREAHYELMLDVSDRGLALAPEHPHLQFARGVALARLGTTRGVLSSLFIAKDLEAAWSIAAGSDYQYQSLGREEVLPCDAMMSLGVYYRVVPDWWIVQVIAGTRGDTDKALDLLRRSDSCAPDRIEVIKELGVGEICIGQQRHDDALATSGRAHLDRALQLPPHKPTDHIDLVHIQMILDHPDMACGYSRDVQQDLDRAHL